MHTYISIRIWSTMNILLWSEWQKSLCFQKSNDRRNSNFIKLYVSSFRKNSTTSMAAKVLNTSRFKVSNFNHHLKKLQKDRGIFAFSALHIQLLKLCLLSSFCYVYFSEGNELYQLNPNRPEFCILGRDQHDGAQLNPNWHELRKQE